MTVAVGRLHLSVFLAPPASRAAPRPAPDTDDGEQAYRKAQTRRQLEDEQSHWQYLRMVSGGQRWL